MTVVYQKENLFMCIKVSHCNYFILDTIEINKVKSRNINALVQSHFVFKCWCLCLIENWTHNINHQNSIFQLKYDVQKMLLQMMISQGSAFLHEPRNRCIVMKSRNFRAFFWQLHVTAWQFSVWSIFFLLQLLTFIVLFCLT